MITIYYVTWLCQLTQMFFSSFTDKFVLIGILWLDADVIVPYICNRSKFVTTMAFSAVEPTLYMYADEICTNSSGILHGREWATVTVSQQNSDETDLKLT